MERIPVIAVCGATASGKTALAVQLARYFDAEVISADSRQIYRYMDIGTAKPTLEEISGVEHYLVDFLEPDEAFSAADYVSLAHKCAAYITAKGKTVLIAGGTGLYMDSFLNDADFGAEAYEEDGTVREELLQLAKERGREYLWELLRENDPDAAKSIHPHNVVRTARALEFFRLTGRKISEHQKQTKLRQSRYEYIKFAIDWERDILYERINKRVDMMMEAGLPEEVQHLAKMGFSDKMQAVIGYKELLLYFEGKLSLEEASELIKRNTRRYAKRQYTWFRRDEKTHWLKPEDAFKQACSLVDSWRRGWSL